MKIRYKRMHLRWVFVFGLFWFILAVISITNNPGNYFNYGYLIVSLLYFGNYYFKNKNQYITFENNMIKLNLLIPKKINLADLTEVKKIGANYKMCTEKTELHIKTKLIEKNSLKDLKAILKKIKLKNN